MATLPVPNPKTWVDGERPDWKDYGTEIFESLDFMLNPPTAWIAANSSTSIVNASITNIITMNEVRIDQPNPYAFFNPAVPTRLVPTTPGRYMIIYGGSWDNVACGCGGRRIMWVRKNGAYDFRSEQRPASSSIGHLITEGHVAFADANGTTDYFELLLFTEGGTVNNGNGTDGWQSTLYMRWMGVN
jgi:hypothetical protein